MSNLPPTDLPVVYGLQHEGKQFDMYLDPLEERIVFIRTKTNFGSDTIWAGFGPIGWGVGGAIGHFRTKHHKENLEKTKDASLDEKLKVLGGYQIGFDKIQGLIIEDRGHKWKTFKISYGGKVFTDTKNYFLDDKKAQEVIDFFSNSPLKEKFRVKVNQRKP